MASAPAFVESEQLEIFTSFKNVPKLSTYVSISQMDGAKDEFVRLSTTEVVSDNNNPEFTKEIVIEYRFEEVQLLRVEMYEADTDEYVGHCEFILGDLVANDGSKLTMELMDKTCHNSIKIDDSPCLCTIQSEEMNQNISQLEIQFSASHLPTFNNRDTVNSNPYLQIYRKAAASDTTTTTNNSNESKSDEWLCVSRTDSLHKTSDPEWTSINISTQRLCNGDYNRDILIKCFHDNDNAPPEEIGYCNTSLQALLDTSSAPLIYPTNNDMIIHCGDLLFTCQMNENYSFLQYINRGMQIQMIVGIDFTASNGNPKKENSLHYIGSDENAYMKAIKSVGSVIARYDYDGMIECYGFGANLNPGENKRKKISHCFNLTLNENENEVKGIDGVLQAYKQSLSKVQLYGPTYFTELISSAARSASDVVNNEREQNYIVLLIIADGIVNDMQKTIDAIVSATELPLSIVILGIGDADFSGMIKLDADETPLKSSKGVIMKRDIVQFVAFNKFKDKLSSDLAKAVLEEIPGQVIDYMKMKKLSPLGKTMNKISDEKKRKYLIDNDNETDDGNYSQPPNKKRKLMH